MQRSRFIYFLAPLLVFPCAIREWIDVLTDIGSYKGNVAMVGKIVSYDSSSIVQTVFDRTINSTLFNEISAVWFIALHLILAIILTWGCVELCIGAYKGGSEFSKYIKHSVVGLAFAIFAYVFFFCVMPMDYFMSMVQGIDYSVQVLASIVPAAIALFFILSISQ